MAEKKELRRWFVAPENVLTMGWTEPGKRSLLWKEKNSKKIDEVEEGELVDADDDDDDDDGFYEEEDQDETAEEYDNYHRLQAETRREEENKRRKRKAATTLGII